MKLHVDEMVSSLLPKYIYVFVLCQCGHRCFPEGNRAVEVTVLAAVHEKIGKSVVHVQSLKQVHNSSNVVRCHSWRPSPAAGLFNFHPATFAVGTEASPLTKSIFSSCSTAVTVYGPPKVANALQQSSLPLRGLKHARAIGCRTLMDHITCITKPK